MLIKTDNEPAVLSLKEEMMMRLEVGVIPVESACNESESIGLCGKWREIVQGYALGRFAGVGAHAEWQHTQSTPCVEGVADIVTKYTQGADGRTGYERLFGKQVHEEGLEFGERVLWRKHSSNDTNVVLDAR